MEFKIINANSVSYLEKRVNEEIRKGWKPQGGPFSRKREGVYQAMIKE